MTVSDSPAAAFSVTSRTGTAVDGEQVAMRGGGGLGGEDLADAVRIGERLGDRLPSLGEEQPGVVPAGAAGELARGGDPARALGQQLRMPAALRRTA